MNGEAKDPLPLGEDHLKPMKLMFDKEDEPEPCVSVLSPIPNPMK